MRKTRDLTDGESHVNPVVPTEFFDRFSRSYDEDLQAGLSLTGEDKLYFVGRRLEAVRKCLNKLDVKASQVLDYGCGTGAACEVFKTLLGINTYVGVDASRDSISLAQQIHSAGNSRFYYLDDLPSGSQFDLAYCNGVFHHIPPVERPNAIRYMFDHLRPGGVVAFWENNAWNPGTRLVMSRIPFDKHAITLTAMEGRRLLRDGGFKILRTNFHFIFPKFLSSLRCLEFPLSSLPIGGQYQIIATRP